MRNRSRKSIFVYLRDRKSMSYLLDFPSDNFYLCDISRKDRKSMSHQDSRLYSLFPPGSRSPLIPFVTRSLFRSSSLTESLEQARRFTTFKFDRVANFVVENFQVYAMRDIKMAAREGSRARGSKEQLSLKFLPTEQFLHWKKYYFQCVRTRDRAEGGAMGL